jgi:cobalt-zinc-cadmium efflux system membrane fusion protein
MKRMIFLLLFSALVFTACKRESAENADKSKSLTDMQQNGLLQMSLSAQQHIGLQGSAASLTHMQEYLRATGTVQPIDSRVASVRPLARGRIVEVHAKVGDRVKAGQTLAVFDNVEAGELIAQLQSARAELEQRKARLAPARRQSERSRRLADIGAGSEKDFESCQAEQQEIEASIRSQQAAINGIEVRLRRFGISNASAPSSFLTALKAPFAGVVTKAQVSTGDFVDESREVFAVANLSQVWVQAEVYEKDLGRIRVGQNASITVDTYPNEHFNGRVAYISDVLDPQTRTARVRCEVANGDLKLKTDMFASVELPTKFDKQAVTVPTSALQEVEGKSVVFIRRSQTQFEKRDVEKGATVNGQTEITRGLKVGEPVVTQGSFHLKSILAGGELGEE